MSPNRIQAKVNSAEKLYQRSSSLEKRNRQSNENRSQVTTLVA